MGRYHHSIAQYRKALEKNPAFTPSRFGIGNDYIFKRAYDEARRWYQDEFDRATTIDGKISAMPDRGFVRAPGKNQRRGADV